MTRILDVRCTKCKWEGKENELLEVSDAYEGKLEACPNCKDCWNLEDNELEDFHNAINLMWNFNYTIKFVFYCIIKKRRVVTK